MDGKFITKGIEVVKEAVAADNANEPEKALALYKQALNYLISGNKYEKNPRMKESIRSKIKQYMLRAEEIQAELTKAKENGGKKKKAKKANAKGKGKKKSGGGGGGGGKKGKDDDDDDDDSEDEKDPETEKLQAALSSAIVTETPNVKWDDVAGLEAAKSLLKEAVILPVKFPQLFTGRRRPWKGILLYGPPGTGKSFLAKAVATEAGASTFLSVSSSDLVSKFQGESERLVKNLFEMARKNAPAIIFIDEVDSLCSARGDGENESARRIKTEFLVQMQGVGKDSEGVLVLGATNTPWELDSAIRRRFEKRIYIPLPDARARQAMFRIHVGDTPNNLREEDFQQLAKHTDGFSGSDISVVVRDALYEPVRTCQSATHFKKVHEDGDYKYVPCAPGDPKAEQLNLMDIDSDRLKPLDVSARDFLKVLHSAKPSVGPGDLQRLEEWTSQFGQEG
eukprot:TRINITY_DN65733_c4_g1_i1.p1 TRINITY_DN65733_c4_g1~~TRINITY_DN65733_c4_g1_i1.p1  ORF type:complete len:452 (+),score=273.75 TRINITY_DN65733_c4_g1_i1:101-1456(+)